MATAVASAALLFGPVAALAACNLKTMDVPVKMEGLRPLVAGKVNGEPVQFLLDSGAFFSTIDAGFAAKQKLKVATGEKLGTRLGPAFETLASGAGGTDRVAGVVVAPTLEFASAKFTNVPFLAFDFGDAHGLLGQNFLRQVDNEYDFKNGIMRMVRAEDCAKTELAYWAKPGTSYSVSPLEPTSRDLNAHNVAIIWINGEKMKAYFDTGAATTFITTRAASRAGVKTSDPGVKRAGFSRGIDRDNIKTWVGRFASVKIGDEEIKNAMLAIGETSVYDFDVLVGADFFMAHHVYVANSQRKLYFTYNGGPVFQSPEPDAETASDDAHRGK